MSKNSEIDECVTNQNNTSNGKLIVITGPMFSRKTCEMLNYIFKYAYSNKKCLIMKFEQDTRYGVKKNEVKTHNQWLIQNGFHENINIQEIKVWELDKYTRNKKKFEEFDVIAIDEPHLAKTYIDSFEELDVIAIDEPHLAKTYIDSRLKNLYYDIFTEEYEGEEMILTRFCKWTVDELKKIVIVAGIDRWYTGEVVKMIWNTLEHCNPEKIKFLRSICSICKNENADAIYTERTEKDKKELIVVGDSYRALCRSCWGKSKLIDNTLK